MQLVNDSFSSEVALDVYGPLPFNWLIIKIEIGMKTFSNLSWKYDFLSLFISIRVKRPFPVIGPFLNFN